MIRFQVYSSLLMGFTIAGIGILMMVRSGNEPPFAFTTFTGYQIGGVLVGYGVLRLGRAYWLFRRKPTSPAEEDARG